MRIRPLVKSDWESVSKIYAQGIASGIATFETELPDRDKWNRKYLEVCRFVAVKDEEVVGYAALSSLSHREVYRGVAEVTVYVSNDHKRQGIGERLLRYLISESETKGFWTLQAGVFSVNEASIALHLKCGFRVVGIREKIGQLKGVWYDNHLLERRSRKVV